MHVDEDLDNAKELEELFSSWSFQISKRDFAFDSWIFRPWQCSSTGTKLTSDVCDKSTKGVAILRSPPIIQFLKELWLGLINACQICLLWFTIAFIGFFPQTTLRLAILVLTRCGFLLENVALSLNRKNGSSIQLGIGSVRGRDDGCEDFRWVLEIDKVTVTTSSKFPNSSTELFRSGPIDIILTRSRCLLLISITLREESGLIVTSEVTKEILKSLMYAVSKLPRWTRFHQRDMSHLHEAKITLARHMLRLTKIHLNISKGSLECPFIHSSLGNCAPLAPFCQITFTNLAVQIIGGRNLLVQMEEFNISLIESSDLAALIRISVSTPMSLTCSTQIILFETNRIHIATEDRCWPVIYQFATEAFSAAQVPLQNQLDFIAFLPVCRTEIGLMTVSDPTGYSTGGELRLRNFQLIYIPDGNMPRSFPTSSSISTKATSIILRHNLVNLYRIKIFDWNFHLKRHSTCLSLVQSVRGLAIAVQKEIDGVSCRSFPLSARNFDGVSSPAFSLCSASLSPRKSEKSLVGTERIPTHVADDMNTTKSYSRGAEDQFSIHPINSVLFTTPSDECWKLHSLDDEDVADVKSVNDLRGFSLTLANLKTEFEYEFDFDRNGMRTLLVFGDLLLRSVRTKGTRHSALRLDGGESCVEWIQNKDTVPVLTWWTQLKSWSNHHVVYPLRLIELTHSLDFTSDLNLLLKHLHLEQLLDTGYTRRSILTPLIIELKYEGTLVLRAIDPPNPYGQTKSKATSITLEGMDVTSRLHVNQFGAIDLCKAESHVKGIGTARTLTDKRLFLATRGHCSLSFKHVVVENIIQREISICCKSKLHLRASDFILNGMDDSTTEYALTMGSIILSMAFEKSNEGETPFLDWNKEILTRFEFDAGSDEIKLGLPSYKTVEELVFGLIMNHQHFEHIKLPLLSTQVFPKVHFITSGLTAIFGATHTAETAIQSIHFDAISSDELYELDSIKFTCNAVSIKGRDCIYNWTIDAAQSYVGLTRTQAKICLEVCADEVTGLLPMDSISHFLTRIVMTTGAKQTFLCRCHANKANLTFYVMKEKYEAIIVTAEDFTGMLPPHDDQQVVDLQELLVVHKVGLFLGEMRITDDWLGVPKISSLDQVFNHDIEYCLTMSDQHAFMTENNWIVSPLIGSHIGIRLTATDQNECTLQFTFGALVNFLLSISDLPVICHLAESLLGIFQGVMTQTSSSDIAPKANTSFKIAPTEINGVIIDRSGATKILAVHMSLKGLYCVSTCGQGEQKRWHVDFDTLQFNLPSTGGARTIMAHMNGVKCRLVQSYNEPGFTTEFGVKGIEVELPINGIESLHQLSQFWTPLSLDLPVVAVLKTDRGQNGADFSDAHILTKDRRMLHMARPQWAWVERICGKEPLSLEANYQIIKSYCRSNVVITRIAESHVQIIPRCSVVNKCRHLAYGLSEGDGEFNPLAPGESKDLQSLKGIIRVANATGSAGTKGLDCMSFNYTVEGRKFMAAEHIRSKEGSEIVGVLIKKRQLITDWTSSVKTIFHLEFHPSVIIRNLLDETALVSVTGQSMHLEIAGGSIKEIVGVPNLLVEFRGFKYGAPAHVDYVIIKKDTRFDNHQVIFTIQAWLMVRNELSCNVVMTTGLSLNYSDVKRKDSIAQNMSDIEVGQSHSTLMKPYGVCFVPKECTELSFDLYLEEESIRTQIKLKELKKNEWHTVILNEGRELIVYSESNDSFDQDKDKSPLLRLCSPINLLMNNCSGFLPLDIVLSGGSAININPKDTHVGYSKSILARFPLGLRIPGSPLIEWVQKAPSIPTRVNLAQQYGRGTMDTVEGCPILLYKNSQTVQVLGAPLSVSDAQVPVSLIVEFVQPETHGAVTPTVTAPLRCESYSAMAVDDSKKRIIVCSHVDLPIYVNMASWPIGMGPIYRRIERRGCLNIVSDQDEEISIGCGADLYYESHESNALDDVSPLIVQRVFTILGGQSALGKGNQTETRRVTFRIFDGIVADDSRQEFNRSPPGLTFFGLSDGNISNIRSRLLRKAVREGGDDTGRRGHMSAENLGGSRPSSSSRQRICIMTCAMQRTMGTIHINVYAKELELLPAALASGALIYRNPMATRATLWGGGRISSALVMRNRIFSEEVFMHNSTFDTLSVRSDKVNPAAHNRDTNQSVGSSAFTSTSSLNPSSNNPCQILKLNLRIENIKISLWHQLIMQPTTPTSNEPVSKSNFDDSLPDQRMKKQRNLVQRGDSREVNLVVNFNRVSLDSSAMLDDGFPTTTVSHAYRSCNIVLELSSQQGSCTIDRPNRSWPSELDEETRTVILEFPAVMTTRPSSDSPVSAGVLEPTWRLASTLKVLIPKKCSIGLISVEDLHIGAPPVYLGLSLSNKRVIEKVVDDLFIEISKLARMNRQVYNEIGSNQPVISSYMTRNSADYSGQQQWNYFYYFMREYVSGRVELPWAFKRVSFARLLIQSSLSEGLVALEPRLNFPAIQIFDLSGWAEVHERVTVEHFARNVANQWHKMLANLNVAGVSPAVLADLTSTFLDIFVDEGDPDRLDSLRRHSFEDSPAAPFIRIVTQVSKALKFLKSRNEG